MPWIVDPRDAPVATDVPPDDDPDEPDDDDTPDTPDEPVAKKKRTRK